MKLKLSEPPRITAIDKKTCKEHPICRYECGHLDKNKDGVRYVLEGAHGIYPAVREPHEVKVFIEIPTEIRWEDGWIRYGYVGKQRVARIAECRSSAFGNELIYVVQLEFGLENFCGVECKSLDEAKAEAQRLFDEWMGGLMG